MLFWALWSQFGFIVKPVIDVTYLTAVLTVRLGFKSMFILYVFIIVASKSLERAKKLLPRSLKACAIEASQLESSLRTAHDRLHKKNMLRAESGGIKIPDPWVSTHF